MKTFKFYCSGDLFQISGQYLKTTVTGQIEIVDNEGDVVAVLPIGTFVYDVASIKKN